MKISRAIFLLFISLHCVYAQNKFNADCDNPNNIHHKKAFLDCITYKSEKLNYRQALNLTQEGIKKYPYNYSLRLNKAILLSNLGNINAAKEELIGLIYLYPNKQELHNYLGRVFYDRDKSKSLLALLTSVYINPKNDVGKENLIFIKRMLVGKQLNVDKPNLKSNLQSFKVDDFDIINARLENLPKKKKLDKKTLAKRLEFFFKELKNYKHRKEGFFWNYYANRYIEIYENNFTKNFTYYISGLQDNAR